MRIRVLRAIGAIFSKPVKQVVVVRRDLRMAPGKLAAQVAHGAQAAMVDHIAGDGPKPSSEALRLLRTWATTGQKTVVVGIDDEVALLGIHDAAEEAGIPSRVVRDAGRTAFGGETTATCCVLGPWDAGAIDLLTGGLRLL